MTNANDLVNADKNTFGSQELGGGLTKREYFAAMAMQGVVANNQLKNYGSDAMSYEAVKWADALIEALNK